MADKKPKAKPVMLVARDYIVTADGTRYEKGDQLPASVAKHAAPSHVVEKK